MRARARGLRVRTWYRRMRSSLRLVPPVVTITSTAMCLPSSLHTCAVCSASSRVGTRSMAAEGCMGGDGQVLVGAHVALLA